ncbi:TetR/AcrR family transcriptional regulator [Mycobacteroides abscessus]|uniref:TetR/AcrR family transcriptional regulator n=1 Tax=Mycobacteroides abscessus TaxID=36809 RepID=UPI00092CAB8D|nr:TetR/AcrR family transcriptional regulator [Mycobacteroides abscessus]SHU87412.1 transcriptional regulatory protein [Mycobacteroides abscessus subsp. bolletii]SHW22417.1 transcriptional regulatory protein [Mycobacteroides abscessus subsp. bolletii]SHW46996.1 transcriptional regulatory protein [Mycobacteroides abscessus subsp. bolletii]SHX91519.1 transcriptional regulatory protein [Mycobacteroides abscessus subsp. bolletii]SKS69472.1 transcriptional regulatory protein [Mycobacteroides absces
MSDQGLNLLNGFHDDADDPILEAAHDEFSISGIQRTNMDTVARHAGVSRATLYRRFPTKSSLLDAVALRAGFWCGKRIARMTEGQTPQEAVVTAFVESARILRSVPFFGELLNFAMSKHIGGDHMLAHMFTKQQFGSTFVHGITLTLRHAGATMPDDELHDVAEILLRMAISITLSPSPAMDVSSDKSIAKFVKKYLAPLVY